LSSGSYIQKISVLVFLISSNSFQFNVNLFVNTNAQISSNLVAKVEQTLSLSSKVFAIFKNIKYDFSLFHHFPCIIAAIILFHSSASSLADAIL
jgi:hypothetical protein